MQASAINQDRVEQFADGAREYSTHYGGSALLEPSHANSTRLVIHGRHQSDPVVSKSESIQALPSKKVKTASRYRPRKPIPGSPSGQQGSSTRDSLSNNAAAYNRFSGASQITKRTEVNRRVQWSLEAPEERASHLLECAQHRLVSRLSQAHLDQSSHQSRPLAENLPEVNFRKDLSSQAPEVVIPSLPELGSPALLSRLDTAAGLHTLARDPIKDHYRLEVLSRLEDDAATEILQRLESTGSNPIRKVVDTERRSSLVTSLRQVFVKPRPLTPVPLLSVLVCVACEGNLPLVKATIALAKESIFLPPERSYNELAIRHAARRGHQDIVDYIISRSTDFGLDDNRGSGGKCLATIALIEAVRGRQTNLASHLLSSRKVNVFMPVALSIIVDGATPRTFFELIVRMDHEHEALPLLRAIMAPEYLTQGCRITRSDTGSQLNAEFRSSVQKSVFVFVKAGWADALELLLDCPLAKSHVNSLMRDDQALACLNIEIRAFGFGTWNEKENAALRRLRILRLLVHKSEYVQAGQHSTNRDALMRALTKAMSQAISLDAPDAVDLIIGIDSTLLSKRIIEKGVSRTPLAWAIFKERYEVVKVLLRKGACPTDWVERTRKSGNNLQLAVHRTAAGRPIAQQILGHMLAKYPELIYDAICEAIRCIDPSLVALLLEATSRKIGTDRISSMRLYEGLLVLRAINTTENSRKAYLRIIDTISNWDTANILPHARAKAVQQAIKYDNRAGVEKLLKIGVIDRAQLDEVLEWCKATSQRLEWRSLLRLYVTQECIQVT
ncbi:hypothetical protein FB567DRAFT_1527 [Paraphoma chrysanthemicola]|uniref:Ankyrin repeat protein n=1 Tax=Paraphoma chrysanthemicola TaxID=798071 RepID=A0A8K0RJ53_9PLEO|nr:hypothetical protein FB567DRAFT_1527 [Paraphoma chrysanthemicola]